MLASPDRLDESVYLRKYEGTVVTARLSRAVGDLAISPEFEIVIRCLSCSEEEFRFGSTNDGGRAFIIFSSGPTQSVSERRWEERRVKM